QAVVAAEVPVDRTELGTELERGQTGLLGDFAHRGGLGVFALLEVTLGEAPVLIGIANQEDVWSAVPHAHDDATGAVLFAPRAPGAQRRLARTRRANRALRKWRGARSASGCA